MASGTPGESLFLLLSSPKAYRMDRENKQYLHREMSLEKAQEVRTLEYKYLCRMNEGTATIPL